ncbi:MAG: DUF4105 domain-containing protein [Spirochaetaceae bacterium]|nr:DUF4105 domain-containing protein [Spirochaetaceae bacterium]
MKLTKIFTLIFLIIMAASPLFPQVTKGEELEVRLFVTGRGDPVWSLWGHTGIAVKNLKSGKDIFFDFGNFYFEDDDFYKNFAIGRLLYMAYAQYTDTYIKSVIRENRDLTEYVLNLSPEVKLKMYEALRTKTLPENRTYLYHHYNDNCSTRIRDYLNDALSGQLEKATAYSRGSTFRNSFLLMTSHKKIVGSFLSLLQGPEIDGEITIWQEMFIPEILGEIVIDLTYRNVNGENTKLVKSMNILNKATERPPLPETYNPPYLGAIGISLILSSLILYLNYRSRKGKIRLFALGNIAAGFILGILGSVLLFLMAFTDHSYSYNNLNLFMINPLALLLIPASVVYLKKGNVARSKIDIIWLIQIISTVIMILLKALTSIKQANQIEIIIVLPLLLSFSSLLPLRLKKTITEAAP